MKHFKILICSVFCLYISACAGIETVAPKGTSAEIQAEQDKQRALAYQGFIDNQTRLYKVAFPILIHNTEFCDKATRPITGLSVWNIHTVPQSFRRVLGVEHNLGEDLVVQNIIRNSPAEKAGLKKGDLLLSLNGEPVPRGEKALKAVQNLVKQSGYKNINIAYIRGNTTKTGIIRPIKGCDYAVLLDNSARVNAFADGRRIIITRGIMRFAQNDSELALVIAHEMAHNTMKHVQKLQRNATAGALGGLAVDVLLGAAGVGTGNRFSRLGGSLAQQRFSVPFEQEADYVGMYFMRRAGYDTAQVANFWRRMAAEGQASIDLRTSHPTSPERFIAIEHTHDEINTKLSKGQKLAPNFAL